MIRKIIQLISNYPFVPARTEPTFYGEMETWVTHGANTTVNEQNQLRTEINNTVDDINAAVKDITTKTATATQASIVAQSAANYKGDWNSNYNNGQGYSLSHSVSFTDGFNYVSKINNNTTSPVSKTNTAQWNWIESIDPGLFIQKSELNYNNGNLGDGTKTYNGFTGQDNFIINGNFISWQLGNSYTGAGYGACDLFFNYNSSDFQQKSEFDNKIWIESTTNSAYGGLATKIEKGADKLSGQTVTLSFDYLPSVGDCSLATVFIGVEGGNTTSYAIPNPTLSGRKSITFTVPAGSYLNKFLLVRWGWSITSTTTKCYISRVKLERGSVATPFVDRGSLEEILCKRYVQVLKTIRFNKFISGTQYYPISLPIVMRTSPTITEAIADINDRTAFNLTASIINSSSITLSENSTTLGFIDINSIKLTAYL